MNAIPIAWFESHLSLKPGTISPETTVNLELGVAGDDGVELVQAVARQFGLEAADFPYDRYFGSEASMGPLSILQAIFRKMRGQPASELEPLSIAKLWSLLQPHSPR